MADAGVSRGWGHERGPMGLVEGVGSPAYYIITVNTV